MTGSIDQITTGFGLLATVWRASRWQDTASNGLTPTQAEILHRVCARPGRSVDLARALGITAATLSDSVSSLLAKGLVERLPDPDDRRARCIAPTPAGSAIARQFPRAPQALSTQIARLPVAEQGAMLRALMRLIRGLQEARAIPVQRLCVTCTHFRPDAHDDPVRPHHCEFVNAAFGDAGLRLECDDHEGVPAGAETALWARFDMA